MGRLVWAFEPLDDLNGETGFVEVDNEALAADLIEQGRVQCGWNPEGGEFRYINSRATEAYRTRQLKAGGPRPAAPEPDPAEPGPEPEAAPEAAPEPEKKRGRPPKAKAGD